MSIAKEPSGSPAGVGFEMQANGSLPVIPLYLPVPPVMMLSDDSGIQFLRRVWVSLLIKGGVHRLSRSVANARSYIRGDRTERSDCCQEDIASMR
jgi:hypothetical protein